MSKSDEKGVLSNTGIAKIFMHGRTEAVRLPLAFRLPGDRVRVRRVEGGILLEPRWRISTPGSLSWTVSLTCHSWKTVAINRGCPRRETYSKPRTSRGSPGYPVSSGRTGPPKKADGALLDSCLDLKRYLRLPWLYA